eukprot:TRINITY_DN25976_c0_g1_i1.p1 TRINITY_DN25976_c0_g1~~TRINITY_DN25976_c0_g1_i1.p1  ORF type:complete len:1367 (+),score=548.38 TRINITY_DN25976_c0_g1_i1:60-4160(+)
MSHLKVLCHDAKELKCRQRFGTSDPYVVFLVRQGNMKQKATTVVRKNTLTPAWKQEFDFEDVDFKHATLRVDVMNKCRLRKDDVLGSVSIPLADLGGGCEQWYPLDQGGQIRLGLQANLAAQEAVAAIEATLSPSTAAAADPGKGRRKKTKEELFQEALDALKAALEKGAMAQGDFDVALRRLHGEFVGPSPLPETMQWLNHLLEVLWPHVDAFTKDLMKSTVEPAIHEAVGSKKFSFKRVNLGARPPQIGPVKCDPCPGGIQLHIGIAYHSEVDVLLEMPLCSVGVKDIRFVGTLSVFMRPLLDEPPFVGGVEVCFANPPTVDLDFLGVGNVADMPGVAGTIRDAIDSAIASACVVPNRIAVPLAPLSAGIDLAALRCPKPEGALVITAVAATNLEAADTKSSDPYVKIRIGASTWKGPVIKSSLNPVWRKDNTAQFVVYTLEQNVEIDVFDYDSASVDDHLGGVRNMPVEWLIKQPGGRVNLQLTRPGKIIEGRLTLQYQWLTLAEMPDMDGDGAAVAPFGCLLAAQIDSLAGLPGSGLNDPFQIRVRVPTEGRMFRGDPSPSTAAGTADPAESGGGGEAAGEQVLKLAVTGKEHAAIADAVDLTPELVKECLEVGEDAKKRQAWCSKATACLEQREAARTPHWHHISHTVMPGTGGMVALELVDSKGATLSSLKRPVALQPDAVVCDAGPFTLRMPDGFKSVELNASLRLFALIPQDPPPFPDSSRVIKGPAAAAAGDDSDDDEPSTGCDRKDALRRALRKRALSQGDYVTLLQKLDGKDPEAAGLAETLEWINKTLKVLWPHISAFVRTTCIDTVQPQIQQAVPAIGSSIHFERCSLGDAPLALGPISVRTIGAGTEWEDDDGLEISLGITFDSSVDIKINSAVAAVGVKDLKFRGTAAVVLRAFHKEPPFFGGLEVCFANPPAIDMDLLGVGNVAELPGINGIVRGIIDDVIASQVVIPHRIGVSLNKEVVSQAQLSFPQPEGVMRLTLVKADGLAAADTAIIGQGTSDPYVMAYVGSQNWKSPVMSSTCDPVWTDDNVKDFVVYSKTQWVRFMVYDYDTIGKDDHLGEVRDAEVRRLLAEGTSSLQLTDSKGAPVQGTMTVSARWLELTQQPSEGPAGCLFSVRADTITGLPESVWKRAPYIVRARVKGAEKKTNPGTSNPDEQVDPEKLRHTVKRLLAEEMEPAQVANTLDISEDLVSESKKLDGDGAELFRQPQSRLQEDLAYVEAMKERGLPHLEKAEKALREEIAGTSQMAKRVSTWDQTAKKSVEDAMAARAPHFHQILYLLSAAGETTVEIELLDKDGAKVLGTCSCTPKAHADPAAAGPGARVTQVSGPFVFDGEVKGAKLEGCVVLRGLRET